MALSETLSFLVGNAPARSAGLKVWETPEIDGSFPLLVSVAVRRQAQYLDGVHAAQQSSHRALNSRGSFVVREAILAGDSADITRRLSQGLTAKRRTPQEGRGVSQSAVETYAAYEDVDAHVQVQERELQNAVALHFDSLSSQSSLAPQWERYRHDVAAVLHAGQGLEDAYAQEHRLLGRLTRNLFGVLIPVTKDEGVSARQEVKRYRKGVMKERQVPSELFATKRLFTTEETEMTVSDLWFLNNGIVDTKDPQWEETITNFMHRAGVIQLPRIDVLAKNAWARIFGGESSSNTVMRVALPFMPVRQLMQARAAVAVANGVLSREYGSETADSYTVYRALSQRQSALDKEAAILEDFSGADEHKITPQPVRNAYMRHISKPLVNRLAAVTARFSL
ncbi:MAG TPA: hypothetical protein VFQ63_03050 [Patescibacteria group bacterium]|nr:hypothetical protein [Patescibacteria group bacterium]